MEKQTKWNSIANWGEGFPDLLTFAAVCQVRHAEEIYELLRVVRGEKGARQAPRPFSQEAWFACYRDPGAAIRGGLSQMGIELPEQAENAQPELPAELLKRLPAFESELQDPKTQQQAIDGICHALVEPWFEHDEALLLELLEPVGEVEKEELEEDCLP